MTLATTVRIVDPLNPRQVFDYCRTLIGADDSMGWDQAPADDGTEAYGMVPGQGLPALLWVNYGVDGPIPDEEGDNSPCVTCVAVVFDSSYLFTGHNGEGCSDLHRALTEKLGAWLDERGADWWAQDEFTGEWHHRTPCPVMS